MNKFKDMLFNRKVITNRKWTEFRNKCDIGDIMHCFTGLRTPDCVKLGKARVLEREYWEPSQIPSFKEKNTSPFSSLTLEEFVYMDGFDTIEDFEKYFSKKQYKDGILSYLFIEVK